MYYVFYTFIYGRWIYNDLIVCFCNRISGERCLVRKLQGNRELIIVPCNILCSDENNPESHEFVFTSYFSLSFLYTKTDFSFFFHDFPHKNVLFSGWMAISRSETERMLLWTGIETGAYIIRPTSDGSYSFLLFSCSLYQLLPFFLTIMHLLDWFQLFIFRRDLYICKNDG